LPSLIIPKKNNTVCFLGNFGEVNKGLVRKPSPIPKISTVLQELEGFSFATALDLNMGYYSIRLDPYASKICTIVFPWGKYSYKQLPMGITGSPDIFQGKMSELMESLEHGQAYFDDLLCISRNSLEDYLEKCDQELRQLCDAGFKVNADKSTFCALEIKYLGYILTRDGIKPQGNKMQTILTIQLPKGVNQLQPLLISLAWCNNLWARWSKNARPSHLIVWRVQSDQSNKSKRNLNCTLALGWSGLVIIAYYD
jgi:hypothetical protein